MRRQRLGTGLGVQGVVTSTRELTEDESESFEVEGLSSAFSGVFEVEGASSDFFGSPTTMIAPFQPGWLNFFFGYLSAKNIYMMYMNAQRC